MVVTKAVFTYTEKDVAGLTPPKIQQYLIERVSHLIKFLSGQFLQHQYSPVSREEAQIVNIVGKTYKRSRIGK